MKDELDEFGERTLTYEEFKQEIKDAWNDADLADRLQFVVLTCVLGGGFVIVLFVMVMMAMGF